MNKTVIIAVLALAIVSVIAGSAIAYRGDAMMQGPQHTDERHDAMTNAFDELDYDAWVVLMTMDGRHPKVVDKITEDNFALFKEMHDANLAGDSVTADALRAELGLGQGSHGGHQGKGQRSGSGNCVYN